MNELTRRIKAKGYTLKDGVKAMGISLSTYRKYEKPGHKHRLDLELWIRDLTPIGIGNWLTHDDIGG